MSGVAAQRAWKSTWEGAAEGGGRGPDVPDIGSKEGETTDGYGQPTYDVTLEENWQGREWNETHDELLTTSQSFRGCKVVHRDGCSGYIGLFCSVAEDDRKPSQTVIELKFGPKQDTQE